MHTKNTMGYHFKPVKQLSSKGHRQQMLLRVWENGSPMLECKLVQQVESSMLLLLSHFSRVRLYATP